jgi:hypothetical protein
MTSNFDSRLLVAILRVARENCEHGNWEELEPILAAAWEDLRDEQTPSWDVVSEEIQEACKAEGVLGGAPKRRPNFP